MKLSLGYLIKFICVNGLVESGTVEEITDEELVIKLADNSLFVVLNPKKNLIAYKILKQECESSKADKVIIDKEYNPEPDSEIDKFYKIENLKIKSLVELHKLKAKEEREQVMEKMRSKKINTTLLEVSFGTPNFSKSVFKYPQKKIR